MRSFLEQTINHLWYHSKRFGWLLSPLSGVFFMLLWFRRKAYRWGLFATYRSLANVIIVGNITVGGTGKTPLVIALIDFLTKNGHKVVVISRGYGRVNKHFVVVNDACTAQDCGDEPLLIFQTTAVPVLVARSRIEAVKYAELHFPNSIIISDDGLQHYALARDIEIAVIDGKRAFGNERLLPAGPLREPVSRLKSVDFTVINGLSGEYKGAYRMILQPQHVRHLQTGSQIAIGDIAAMGLCLALTAIGNPSRFFKTIRSLGLTFTTQCFPDHYLFKREDLVPLKDKTILVTAKDAVKLKRFGFDNIYVLDVAAVLPISFYQRLLEKI